jgi:hypothetical protein
MARVVALEPHSATNARSGQPLVGTAKSHGVSST